MEGSSTESSGGDPAPFVVKTYEMVDDSTTDDMVSWSPTNNSFIVRNPDEFSSRLLSHYFKHNNFSSFIRQLNTYGFHKINHDQWEFANEYFVRDQRHLLINIQRKRTNNNHSAGDPERLAYEEEIERLSNENAAIESNISSLKQRISARKFHMGNLQQRLDGIALRQKNLLNSFNSVLRNPKAVERIYEKIVSAELIGCHKKMRFPPVGNEDEKGAHDKVIGEGELPKEMQTKATPGFVSGKEGSFVSYSPSDNSTTSEGEKRLSSEQKSEESDHDQTSCLSNLTLISSANDKESDGGGALSNKNSDDAVTNLASSQKSPSPSNNQEIKAEMV
ncbi:heat stress transcription factor A-5-like isoform X2 [Vicia villosa]|uniref:heat stress transcription factor A-5-like isoform X2 n=1 Tax=Vicia villosa TaxID=3911 RepID=UPI00273CC47C|nr:heat stress transcription factor A-5-like isoform X2 [Vicia villosa]